MLLAACGITGPEIEIQGTGTVEFVDVLEGCWVIRTTTHVLGGDGLPADLKVHGIRVRFVGTLHPDLVSTCPGRIVTLHEVDSLKTIVIQSPYLTASVCLAEAATSPVRGTG